ncbi:rhomboid family intramembrane serine protease [Planctomicrobium sp. SH664]|uniref:rhomboid family intramembrane serine protease n=1 Tax=Planctomicrobium sp. SH664 TaxID=3448125 RepID=UPI003F5B8072
MGIEYRGYMQDEPGYGFQRRPAMTMVKGLIITNVVIFVIQVVVGGWVEKWFMLTEDAVLKGQLWRFTTYDFLHDPTSIWHLLFNMWLLYMAGTRVESKYGSKEFLSFYLLAGIFSGAFYLLWNLVVGQSNPAIGASGAVVAVLIVYALNWPEERWFIFGIIPMPVMWIAILTAAFDIFPMLQQLGRRAGAGDEVAHAAHAGGMLFAYLYVRNRWQILDWTDSFRKMFRRRPKLRVHRPDVADEVRPAVKATIPPHISARLDQLLQKISDEGEASLTREEREFLTDASRRYRQRG